MTETEARIRCLELAAQLTARTDRHNGEGIVGMARELFAFASEGSSAAQSPSKATRPKKASRSGR